ncbi:MAG: nucleotidyltransferase domain-containing protein [Candidimonas sp.]|nr:MAG: nucleotidyltransferase domain-containing protein [Candidimonas sp.]
MGTKSETSRPRGPELRDVELRDRELATAGWRDPASRSPAAVERSSAKPVVATYSGIVAEVKARVPDAMAIYAFGSRIRGNARPDSDLDLAVLVAGYADPVALWALAGDLEAIAGCAVDLLDFRAASTVMQEQILRTGVRLWSAGAAVDAYEAFALNEKLALDERRAPLIEDILARGTVYGR